MLTYRTCYSQSSWEVEAAPGNPLGLCAGKTETGKQKRRRHDRVRLVEYWTVESQAQGCNTDEGKTEKADDPPTNCGAKSDVEWLSLIARSRPRRWRWKGNQPMLLRVVSKFVALMAVEHLWYPYFMSIGFFGRIYSCEFFSFKGKTILFFIASRLFEWWVLLETLLLRVISRG